MAITSSQILSSNSLEELRQEFNNVVTDVTTLDSATVSAITITANNSTNETVYPVFVDGATGSQDLETDTGLSYNPSTGLLTTAAVTTTGDVTVGGELDAVTLDISGNADIDGTLEADAYTVDGTALNEYIADTVGAMVTSNTETGIAVTYEDGDNTLDFVLGTLNQDTTGTADNFTVSANNSTNETVYPVFVDGATGSQGAESDTGLTYNPSSGLLTSTGFSGNLTGTLQTAAQGNVTSVGALDGGSITSGFGAIDNGTSNIRSATITAETAFVPDASDGAALGTSSLEFSDLFLADGAIIYAGADQDWSATHIADNEMRLGDSDIWSFGAAGDLKIYHNGTDSYITDVGTGVLKITTDGGSISFQKGNSEVMATMGIDGAVSLYYDNAVKLATSSAGATVTGVLTATLQANAIDSDHYVDGSIDVAHMAANSIDSAQYVDGSIDTAHYAAGSVDATALGADCVTAAKIGDNVVDSEHINAGAIDAEHMAHNSIDSGSYVDGSIDTAHYAAGSVDATALGADCVTAAKIGDNVLNSEHYAAGSIDQEHMAANSIDSDQYVDGSIDAAHLAADCVTAAKIGDNVLNSEHYAAGSIDNEHLAANSVDSAQYVDDSIDTAHYAAGSVDATALGADCVTAAKIGDNVINSEHYAADSIDAEHYAAGSVDATALGADCVTAAKIGDNVINSEHYAADSIDEEHLANDCVGSAELKTLSTLLIKNSSGSTLKTVYGAGA